MRSQSLPGCLRTLPELQWQCVHSESPSHHLPSRLPPDCPQPSPQRPADISDPLTSLSIKGAAPTQSARLRHVTFFLCHPISLFSHHILPNLPQKCLMHCIFLSELTTIINIDSLRRSSFLATLPTCLSSCARIILSDTDQTARACFRQQPPLLRRNLGICQHTYRPNPRAVFSLLRRERSGLRDADEG